MRADESQAQPDATLESEASFEGFADHLARKGRPVEVETAGPTCNAQDPIALEMAHRQAIARMQARMIAEAQAHAAQDGESPNVVVLNGRGYNYRSPEPGVPTPMPPVAPER